MRHTCDASTWWWKRRARAVWAPADGDRVLVPAKFPRPALNASPTSNRCHRRRFPRAARVLVRTRLGSVQKRDSEVLRVLEGFAGAPWA